MNPFWKVTPSDISIIWNCISTALFPFRLHSPFVIRLTSKAHFMARRRNRLEQAEPYSPLRLSELTQLFRQRYKPNRIITGATFVLVNDLSKSILSQEIESLRSISVGCMILSRWVDSRARLSSSNTNGNATVPDQQKSLTAATAFRFVLILGIANGFADLTYEGARSVTGQFLGHLGASAAVIGFTAGLSIDFDKTFTKTNVAPVIILLGLYRCRNNWVNSDNRSGE